jgi:hypothetical protein
MVFVYPIMVVEIILTGGEQLSRASAARMIAS